MLKSVSLGFMHFGFHVNLLSLILIEFKYSSCFLFVLVKLVDFYFDGKINIYLFLNYFVKTTSNKLVLFK